MGRRRRVVEASLVRRQSMDEKGSTLAVSSRRWASRRDLKGLQERYGNPRHLPVDGAADHDEMHDGNDAGSAIVVYFRFPIVRKKPREARAAASWRGAEVVIRASRSPFSSIVSSVRLSGIWPIVTPSGTLCWSRSVYVGSVKPPSHQ